MARRHRRGHRGGMKLPILSLAILAGQLGLAYRPGNLGQTANEFQKFYTGIDFFQPGFYPQNLLIGYGPWLAKRFLLPIARPRISGMHLPVSLS